jgi:hypothetical protein
MQIGNESRVVTTRLVGFRRRGQWTLRFIRCNGRVTVATSEKLWKARAAVERELGGVPPKPDLTAIGRLAGQIIAQRLTGHPPEAVAIPSDMAPGDVQEAVRRAARWLDETPPDSAS